MGHVIAKISAGVLVFIVGLMFAAGLISNDYDPEDGAAGAGIYCLIIAVAFEAAYIAVILW